MPVVREIIVHNEAILPAEQPPGFIAEYTYGRNLAVASHIAPLIGGEVSQSPPEGAAGAYHVPSRPLLQAEADLIGIREPCDLFGGVVHHPLHHDKGILHALVQPEAYANPAYSRQFAQQIEDAVLPGYTVFSPDDAHTAYRLLKGEGHKVRWKDPCGEGGNGQVLLHNKQHLEVLLRTPQAQKIAELGLVLEAHVHNPITRSIGTVMLGGKEYSYHGMQAQTPLEDTTTYGGTTLTMVRGGLQQLEAILPDGAIRRAVHQARVVSDMYSWYTPTLSRTNFDVVQSTNWQDGQSSGVVDQSLRIGGASPAEVMAVRALVANPALRQVTAQVEILWDQPEQEPGPGDVVFFEHPRRRDVARVVGAM